MFYVKIKDFLNDLNYTGVILHISEGVNRDDLEDALIEGQVNCMNLFDKVWDDKFFYIENRDLRTLDSSIEEIFYEWNDEYWSVLNLVQIKNEFGIKVPNPIYWNGPAIKDVS